MSEWVPSLESIYDILQLFVLGKGDAMPATQRNIDIAWAIGNDLMAANYLDMPIECCIPIIVKALERAMPVEGSNQETRDAANPIT